MPDEVAKYINYGQMTLDVYYKNMNQNMATVRVNPIGVVTVII